MIEGATYSIFLSYRRSDSGGYAGWLRQVLAERFPDDEVFRDVDALLVGERWVDRLDATLARCNVLVAVIGPDWLRVANEKGRRLDDPEDRVRLELEAGIRREVPLIPALVGGASMPAPALLPSSLVVLHEWQAVRLSDESWQHDVDQLVAAIERLRAAVVPRDELESRREESQTAKDEDDSLTVRDAARETSTGPDTWRPGATFRSRTLAGARLLKVASKTGKVALCDLKKDGSLRERWLPRSPEGAASRGEPWEDEAWDGDWLVEGGRLKIEVRKYSLDLHAEQSGLHFGVERFGRQEEEFAAVLVDPRFDLPAAEPWTALKLGSGDRGFRGSLACEPGGRLRERYLFDRDTEASGDWEERDGELIVTVGERVLTATPFRQVPGVWLGTERKRSAVTGGFALVRYDRYGL